MDRKQVGQQRLGAPISDTFDALVNAVDRKPWTDFQREPVGYYFSKMIGAWLLRLMDERRRLCHEIANAPWSAAVTSWHINSDERSNRSGVGARQAGGPGRDWR